MGCGRALDGGGLGRVLLGPLGDHDRSPGAAVRRVVFCQAAPRDHEAAARALDPRENLAKNMQAISLAVVAMVLFPA